MRRGAVVVALLAAAVTAGAVAAYTHPAWVSTARQDAQGAASALATALGTPPPSALPSTAPSATPRPSPPPVTLAPTPSTPTPGPVWSAADCTWAIAVLAQDATLDQQAQDQGRSPASEPTYYGDLAARWRSVHDAAAAACATPPAPLAGTMLTAPVQWFLTARVTHQVDEANVPADRAWDDQWIAVYTRLLSLWAMAAEGAP